MVLFTSVAKIVLQAYKSVFPRASIRHSFVYRRVVFCVIALTIATVDIYYLYPGQSAWERGHKVRIGVGTWPGYGALHIAKEKNFFNGIDVDIQKMREDDLGAAMLLGTIDAYCSTLDGVVPLAAGGVPGRIVYLFSESAGATDLIVRPEVSSIKDLKDKRISSDTGHRTQFLLLYLLQLSEVGTNDYIHINLNPEEAGSAFFRESGDLAGVVTEEPWLTRILDGNKGKLLISTLEHHNVIVGALVIKPELAVRRADLVRALVAGLAEATEFWNTDPSKANELVARSLSLKVEDVSKTVGGIRYLDRVQNRAYLKQGGQAARILALADRTWRANGRLQAAPNLPTLITDEFVK